MLWLRHLQAVTYTCTSPLQDYQIVRISDLLWSRNLRNCDLEHNLSDVHLKDILADNICFRKIICANFL
jgi:hypothetical protein